MSDWSSSCAKCRLSRGSACRQCDPSICWRVFEEQRPKAGLAEVFVSGQRVGQAAVSHDDEGGTIGQAPVFVRPIR